MTDPTANLGTEALLAHSAWVRTLARAVVSDRDQIDDVVQETWRAVIETPPRHTSNVTAWLRRVVTNNARQIGRRESRRVRRERDAVQREDVPCARELVEAAELQREVVAAVLALEEPYRSTVLLRYYRDKSAEEIAVLQGVPAGTVRSRLHRALEQLRPRLETEARDGRAGWGGPAALFATGWKGKLAVGAAMLGLAALGIWRATSPVAPEPAPETISAAPVLESPTDPEPTPERDAPALASEHEARAPISPTEQTSAIYRGRVLDDRYDPVAGGTVELYPTDGDWHEAEPFGTARTDAAGRFEIELDRLPDVGVLANATAPGYVSSSKDPVTPQVAIDFTLPRAHEIAGRVLDAETREPIEGAAVSGWGGVVQTDLLGTFRLTEVGAGWLVSVLVTADGYAAEESSIVAQEPVTEPEILLRRGVPLSVLVFDAGSGAPLAGARARHLQDEGAFAVTGEDGLFTVHLVEGNSLELRIEREGYASFSWYWEVRDTGILTRPRIPMVGLAWIDGRVVDAAGTPLAGQRLQASSGEVSFDRSPLTPQEQVEYELPGHARREVPDGLDRASDESGEFSVAVLPADSDYFLHGGGRDGVPARVGPLRVDQPGRHAWADVVLHAGATVRGRVLFNEKPWFRGDVYWQHSSGTRGGYERPDLEGRYVLKNVPAGDVQVVARELGRRAACTSKPFPVRAGGVHERDLSWAEETGTIRGRVVDERGAPVAGQRVTASFHSPEGDYRSFQVDTYHDGEYELDVVLPHAYSVSVSRKPHREVRESVEPWSDGVNFVLPDIGSLKVSFVDARTGEPVAIQESWVNALSWRTTGTDVFHGIRDVLELVGSTVEMQLPVGRIDLSLFLNEDGYAPKTVIGIPVTKDAGAAPFVVELSLGVGVKLSLTGDEPMTRDLRRGHLFFLLEEGQLDSLRGPYPHQGGPSNHRINGVCMWVGEPGLIDQMPEFDDTGIALLSGLAAGKYSLRCYPDDYAFEPETFELTDERTEIELKWSRR